MWPFNGLLFLYWMAYNIHLNHTPRVHILKDFDMGLWEFQSSLTHAFFKSKSYTIPTKYSLKSVGNRVKTCEGQ